MNIFKSILLALRFALNWVKANSAALFIILVGVLGLSATIASLLGY